MTPQTIEGAPSKRRSMPRKDAGDGQIRLWEFEKKRKSNNWKRREMKHCRLRVMRWFFLIPPANNSLVLEKTTNQPLPMLPVSWKCLRLLVQLNQCYWKRHGISVDSYLSKRIFRLEILSTWGFCPISFEIWRSITELRRYPLFLNLHGRLPISHLRTAQSTSYKQAPSSHLFTSWITAM